MHVGDVVAVGAVGAATAPLLRRIEFLAWVNDGGGGEIAVVLEEFFIKEEQRRCWKRPRKPDRIVCFVCGISCACVRAGTAVVTVLKPLHAAMLADI